MSDVARGILRNATYDEGNKFKMSDMTIVYNFNYVRCDESNDFENVTYDEGYKFKMSDVARVIILRNATYDEVNLRMSDMTRVNSQVN